jgi:glycosyltransferase involved in cell wall biosynthesis
MAHIGLLEPYHTGSHARWADGLTRFTSHTIVPYTLPGRFWKWRMHGAAVTLVRRFLEDGALVDLFLATDMLDLTTFLALTRPETANTPCVAYFHENQLTYPPPPGEKRDLHYGFTNYTSALAADRVLFNSAYHRAVFLDELPSLLKHLPDFNELGTIDAIAARSDVLPLGLDLRRFDAHRPRKRPGGPLRILWNHRWEYDKQPGIFFEALYRLQEEGLAFEVTVLGKSFRQQPDEFREAEERLAGHIRHWGYVEDFAAYARLVWEADVQVSCAIQDFFGSSSCEAIYCDCFPILPNRLNYPSFIPEEQHAACLYDNTQGLVERLRRACENPETVRAVSLRRHVEGYDWQRLINRYDAVLSERQTSKSLTTTKGSG